MRIFQVCGSSFQRLQDFDREIRNPHCEIPNCSDESSSATRDGIPWTVFCLIFSAPEEFEIAKINETFVTEYCCCESTKADIGPLDSPYGCALWVKIASQRFQL